MFVKPITMQEKVQVKKKFFTIVTKRKTFSQNRNKKTGSGNKTGAPSAAKLDLNAQKRDRVEAIKDRYGL